MSSQSVGYAFILLFLFVLLHPFRQQPLLNTELLNNTVFSTIYSIKVLFRQIMDNILTAAELKRRGMAAIEEGLQKGPVHIVKRNRPAAVVLTEAEYQRLAGGRAAAAEGMTAVQWLLAHPGKGGRSKAQIDAGLRDERNW